MHRKLKYGSYSITKARLVIAKCGNYMYNCGETFFINTDSTRHRAATKKLDVDLLAKRSFAQCPSNLPSNRLYDLPPRNRQVRFALKSSVRFTPPKSPSPICPQIVCTIYPPPKSPSPICPQIICTIPPPLKSSNFEQNFKRTQHHALLHKGLFCERPNRKFNFVVKCRSNWFDCQKQTEKKPFMNLPELVKLHTYYLFLLFSLLFLYNNLPLRNMFIWNLLSYCRGKCPYRHKRAKL